MSCCSSIKSCPEDTVGECPSCEGEVDIDGYTTEGGCTYSPVSCETCGYRGCDQSC